MTDNDFTVRTLTPGQEFQINRHTVIESFKTYHTRESQGYILYTVKHKLRPEYYSRSGNELKELKQQGHEITRRIRIPEIAITGDMKFQTLLQNEELKRVKVLVMEMTFLDGHVSVKEARARGHVHVEEVWRNWKWFESVDKVLFTHFSARYTKEGIEEVVKKRLGDEVGKKVWLMSGADLKEIKTV